MHLVDLHAPTSRRTLEVNPDLRSLAATQAKRTAIDTRGKSTKRSTLGSVGQKTRSHKADDRFENLAEASFPSLDPLGSSSFFSSCTVAGKL